MGLRFAAVMLPEAASSLPSEVLDQLAGRGAVLVADASPGLTAMLEDFGAKVLLLRPDRHVLGAAPNAGTGPSSMTTGTVRAD